MAFENKIISPLETTAIHQAETFPRDLKHELTMAITIRRTEEKLLSLFSEGRLFGTVHTCIGQEWCGIAVAQNLRPDDFVVSNHRCHGHYIARTDDVEGLIAEVMGRTSGACGGRGGSQHLYREGFCSNGVQGGMLPVAAGIALAKKREGRDSVCVIFIGDGTLGEGVVYEAMNIASKWELPLLVVLENNYYAQSTPQHSAIAGDLLARATAFSIDTAAANTWDVSSLLKTTRECVENVRKSRRPTFLQIDTYRLSPHSKGDDNRDPNEVQTFRQRDVISKLLSNSVASSDIVNNLEQVDQRITAAVARAEEAPYPTQLDAVVCCASEPPCWIPVSAAAEERVVDAIRRGIMDEMKRDERILLIGEDILSPYGGAFKVTQGLSDVFPERVLGSPISEAAIVGVGSGLAMQGYRPVVEIMFGDFLLLASDQLVNHAAKFRWMYNDQVSVPLVIRTPMGGGRGYGPTHSQSLEKHILGVPGTQVIALSHRFSPADVYRVLLTEADRPTVVIEDKRLYSVVTTTQPPFGFALERTSAALPTVRLRPVDGADVTICAYGSMALEAEAAMEVLFSQHDVLCDLVMPLSLYPFDISPILESVSRTGRLVVVEEGQGFVGLGSEIICQTLENLPAQPVRAKRVVAQPCPIPASRPLEQCALPGRDSIVNSVLDLCNG